MQKKLFTTLMCCNRVDRFFRLIVTILVFFPPAQMLPAKHCFRQGKCNRIQSRLKNLPLESLPCRRGRQNRLSEGDKHYEVKRQRRKIGNGLRFLEKRLGFVTGVLLNRIISLQKLKLTQPSPLLCSEGESEMNSVEEGKWQQVERKQSCLCVSWPWMLP